LSITNTRVAGHVLEVGILADEVADVITIFKEDIQPPLTTHTGVRAEYIQGITADLLVVLNLTALLSDKRLIIQEELL
jgi:purine-binding chemotaxis protein CheW